MKKLSLALAAVVALTAAPVSWSQQKVFSGPVTIACASAAGGGTDQINRALAEGMKETLGVQVNVVNMPGGGMAIGMDYVWGKPHDGTTLSLIHI